MEFSPIESEMSQRIHIWAAWRMAGTGPRRSPDGSWTYPDTDAVMKTVGLRSISHYVEVRRQHIFNFIVTRPIFNACRGGVRRRGSSHCQFWWDQSLSLKDDPPAGVDDSDDEDGGP